MSTSAETFPQRFGEFALLASLGAGGMGRAYLAAHPDWSGLVVLKRMHAHYQNDPEVFRRFLHEAKTATHVRHPAVAGAIAVGTVGPEPFFATEYVFGLPLSVLVDRMERGELARPALGVGLYLALDLVKGLEAIHEAVDRDTGTPLELIHRDIGSRNALVGFDGRLRIIDLGLGRSLLSDWETAADTVAGSPDYMPPEQATGERVDRRADVYSASVTIFEILAGRKRIRAETVAERLRLAATARPEQLRRERGDVSAELELALAKAMAPDPADRSPHARVLRRALEAELRASAGSTRREDVVRWLEAPCEAERRALGAKRREAEAVAGQLLSGPAEETRIHAALPPLTRAPDDAFEHTLEEPTAPRASAAPSAPPSVGLARRRAAALLAGAAALLAGAALLGRWRPAARSPGGLGGSAPAIRVEPLSSPEPRSNPNLEGIEAGETEPEPEALGGTSAPEPEVAPSEDASPTLRGAPKPLPPALTRRKRALAGRLQALRRARFDVAYQRQLTVIGQGLSRARSEAELDEVERRVRRLEEAR